MNNICKVETKVYFKRRDQKGTLVPFIGSLYGVVYLGLFREHANSLPSLHETIDP